MYGIHEDDVNKWGSLFFEEVGKITGASYIQQGEIFVVYPNFLFGEHSLYVVSKKGKNVIEVAAMHDTDMDVLIRLIRENTLVFENLIFKSDTIGICFKRNS